CLRRPQPAYISFKITLTGLHQLSPMEHESSKGALQRLRFNRGSLGNRFRFSELSFRCDIPKKCCSGAQHEADLVMEE
ncbi:hypothetical protein, partial [Agrobacterium pusense]|uniref:hypothetical protein n=1 Tax=Agrobacterium pusense TaxID=648995 RepID=UPI0028B03D4E